jgi:ketosteroid isomerase-like protein
MQSVTSAVLATVLLATPGAATPREQAEATRQVSARYLQADTAGRYEDLLEIYASDAVFTDPTADVFKGPISKGPVVGSKAIVALQKSWGLVEQSFAVQGSFAVADIALHRGMLTVRYDGSQERLEIPFVTVHRVRDGRIAERIDFGEYVESFGLGDGFDDATESTKAVAERYLRAYLAADFESQAVLCADDIVFQDPTARVYGDEAGQPIVGREALLQRRKRTFENVTDFGLDVEQSFAANHHAVFMGKTSYTVGGRKWTQPAVFVVEVREGRVTRHWDFVDYSVGPAG